MAIHKAKVIGPREIGGVQPGRTVTLDDELVNVAALIDGGHIELLPPEPKKSTKKGDD